MFAYALLTLTTVLQVKDEEEMVQYPLADAQRVLLKHDPEMVALAEDKEGNSLMMKAVAADNVALFGVLVKVCTHMQLGICVATRFLA